MLVLAVVIGVQQLEGHVLQPLIMGRAVSIHPLAVILAIATGLVLAGIIGALVAVPLVAVLNTAIRHLAAHRRHEPDPPPPDEVVVRCAAQAGRQALQALPSRRTSRPPLVVYQNGGSEARR